MSKEEDESQLVHHDELARELQPHLGPQGARENEGCVSLDEVTATIGNGDENRPGDGRGLSAGNSSGDVNGTGNGNENLNGNVNGSAKTGGTGEVTLSAPPVYYSSTTGQTNIVNEPIVIRQPNGIHVIRTRECCHTQNNYRHERPLTLKHIKFLKGFTILSVIIFFPLGIPAMYYAFKSEKEFHAGVLRGNLDLARKMAKRSERLIIFSVMAALLVAVAVFAFVERTLMEHDDEYWRDRNNNRVLPSG